MCVRTCAHQLQRTESVPHLPQNRICADCEKATGAKPSPYHLMFNMNFYQGLFAVLMVRALQRLRTPPPSPLLLCFCIAQTHECSLVFFPWRHWLARLSGGAGALVFAGRRPYDPRQGGANHPLTV